MATQPADQENLLTWGLIAGNAVDLLQTSQFHNRGIGEANPLFQEAVRTNNMTTVVMAKVVYTSVFLYFLQSLPQAERIQSLQIANIISWSTVCWNEAVSGGIVFRFNY